MNKTPSDNPQWLDVLAGKARDAQSPPDDALWSEVEARLPRARRRAPWLWFTAAAAAAAIVTFVLLTPSVTTPPTMSHPHGASLTESPSIPPEGGRLSATNSPLPCEGRLSATNSPLPSQGRGRGGVKILNSQLKLVPDSNHQPDSLRRTWQAVSLQNGDEAQPLAVVTQPESESGFTISPLKPTASHKRSLSVTLYGSGDLLAQNGTQTAAVQRPMLMAMGNGRFMETRATTRYEYKHRIPLNVGVMVNKSLPCNLTAGIGVNYALYGSEVTADLEHFNQTVQFVGIPVALRWRFWRSGNWSAYVGGEAMAERCIDVDTELDNIEVPHRIQWSVHGVAGLQYSLTDRVGLFVEPKVSHFITELPLTTVRNEHPLNVNLKLGANVNF